MTSDARLAGAEAGGGGDSARRPSRGGGGLRDRHLKYLLVLPAVAVVFATAIWPLVDSLVLSFRAWRLSRSNVPGPFVGLENYVWAIVEEPPFWNAVQVTGVYTVLTVGLTTLLALGAALLLAPGGRLRFTVRTLLILIIEVGAAPSATP